MQYPVPNRKTPRSINNISSKLPQAALAKGVSVGSAMRGPSLKARSRLQRRKRRTCLSKIPTLVIVRTNIRPPTVQTCSIGRSMIWGALRKLCCHVIHCRPNRYATRASAGIAADADTACRNTNFRASSNSDGTAELDSAGAGVPPSPLAIGQAVRLLKHMAIKQTADSPHFILPASQIARAFATFAFHPLQTLQPRCRLLGYRHVQPLHEPCLGR